MPPRKHVSCPNRLSPRPGRKRFETSVPTDLSRSTIKSQWTNGFENIREIKETKNKQIVIGIKKENHEEWITSPNISKTKSRCKYKNLKNRINAKLQPIVDLQSTTNIAKTGYNDTNNENRLLERYQPKSKGISEQTRKDDKNVIYPKIGNKKENYEELITSPNILKRKSKSKYKNLKDYIIAELQPIVVLQSTSDIDQTGFNDTNNENRPLERYQPKSKRISEITNKDNKNVIYTKIVETGSVNHLEKEFSYQQLPKNPNHSKFTLETPANQFDLYKIGERELQTFDKTQKHPHPPSPKHSDSIRTDEREECYKQLLKSVQSQLSEPHKVPKSPLPQKSSKLQSDSSQHKKATQLKPAKTSKATKKTTSKIYKKETIEENFYGALKVIAKNKKFNQKIVVNDQPKRRRKVLPTESTSKQHVNYPKHSINNRKQSINNPKQSINNPKQSINNPKQSINNTKQSINDPHELLIYPKQFIDYPKKSISYSKKNNNSRKSRFRKNLASQESFLSILPHFAKPPISAVEYYDTDLNRSDSETSDYISPSNFALRK